MEERPRKKARKSVPPADSGYRQYAVDINIPLGPIFSNKIREGIVQVLDGFVGHYIPSLGFVLLTFSPNTVSISPEISLIEPTAFMICRVSFQAVGWRPVIGSTLRGKLVHSVQSHASLIINSTFNASIAADHLPPDKYHYDPDAVDPHSELDSHLMMDDFYADQWQDADKQQLARRGRHESEDVVMLAGMTSTQDERDVSLGCWVHKKSKRPLGGDDGMLSFTVIGSALVLSNIIKLNNVGSQ